MKNIIISITVLLYLTSCNEIEKKDVKESNDNFKNKSSLTFLQRDNQKGNFIFLNFWIGMSKEDYNTIKDSLVKNETLEKDINGITWFKIFIENENNSNDNSVNVKKMWFILKPVFSLNKLVEIRLKDNAFLTTEQSLIKLYSTKYGYYKIEEKEIEYIKRIFYNHKIKNVDIEKAKGKEYVKYIWDRPSYYIIISEWYSQKKSTGEGGYYISSDSLTITYTDKDFILKMTKEKEKKNKEEKKKIDKTIELI